MTSETFTVVGYGTDDFIKGSALSPNQVTVFDGVRSYREITAINTHDAFPDRFLKVTAGVCFGDSGGPMFHDGTIVALNTWTFSLRCTGPTRPSHRRSSTPTSERAPPGCRPVHGLLVGKLRQHPHRFWRSVACNEVTGRTTHRRCTRGESRGPPVTPQLSPSPAPRDGSAAVEPSA